MKISVTKAVKRVLKWVRKAGNNESHPSLMCFDVREGRVAAADGFRIHWVNADLLGLDLEDGQYQMAFHGEAGFVEPFVIDRYPDLTKVFPTGEPVVRFAMMRDLLRAALDMPVVDGDRRVVIELYADTQMGKMPVVIRDMSGNVRALVMPAHLREGSGWRLNGERKSVAVRGCEVGGGGGAALARGCV